METALVSKLVLDIIEKKYQVIDVVDLVNYSADAELLAKRLEHYFNKHFDHNQRLVILHHDTDYYPSPNSVGNCVHNFFSLCSDYLIPLEKVIFVTNHYGIEEELNNTAMQLCNSAGPKVIYTSHWFDFPTKNDLQKNVPSWDPEYLFCCLNNQQRSHRVLTLCMLKEYGLVDQGIISYNFGAEQ